ncbi:MAG: C-type lectin domain-containing protein [Phycisphaerales bacterium]
MNRPLSIVSATAALLVTLAGAQAQVLGPRITNPATGNRYYRLNWTGATWTQMRNYARNMGGDLVTINDAAEQTWLVANVLQPNAKYFIGLSDAAVEGTFVWSDGSPSTYRNFAANTGDNSQGSDYALIATGNSGLWDVRNETWTSDAVIEVSGGIYYPGEASTLSLAIQLANTSGLGEVRVAPGTHTLETGINVPGNIVLRGSGAGVTTLQGPPTGPAFTGSSNLTFEDITLTSRDTLPFISLPNVAGTNELTFRRSVMTSILGRSNTTFVGTGYEKLLLEGCTIHTLDTFLDSSNTSTAIRMVNTVFRDNNRFLNSADSNLDVVMTNCVFARNLSDIIPVNSAAFVTNSIALSNASLSRMTFWDSLSPAPLPNANPAANNTVANPGFVNAAGNDFRLLETSPAIDRGNPARFLTSGATALLDAVSNARIRDAKGYDNADSENPIDIGAFEFQGDMGCDDIDFNNDTSIFDPMDIDAFLSVYSEGPCIR